MGGAKQFHPVETDEGIKPLVAAAFDAIAPVCSHMVVVFGHRAQEVAELLAGRDFVTQLADADEPMIASIHAGVRTVQQIDPEAAVLLQPADHPRVSRATLNRLVGMHITHPRKTIIPTFDRRGGHPIVIPGRLSELLLRANCPEGLGRFWQDHPEYVMKISCSDPSVLEDVDHV